MHVESETFAFEVHKFLIPYTLAVIRTHEFVFSNCGDAAHFTTPPEGSF
jgi:hypothetical protein